MSGHSHWAGIKHQKSLEDQKRGNIFSKISRIISVAVREGTDPDMNSKLRQALDEAKVFNMPKDKIERAIKRGTGELKEEGALEEVSYEAFGPGGTAILVEGITDNKNRTLAEIKHVLQRYGGKLAQSGSVKWLFGRKGVITINTKNQIPNIKEAELELKAIEAGAEDMYWHKEENGELLDVYTKPEALNDVRKNLESKGLKIESASLDWVAKDSIEVAEKDKENLEKLFEGLDENEAVQDIYSNLKT